MQSDAVREVGGASGEMRSSDRTSARGALALDDMTRWVGGSGLALVPAAKPSRGSTVALREIDMKAIKNLLAKLLKDEQGGEVLEYALIAGLIVVAAIAVIGAVGTKVVARWTSLNSSM